jgi:hypothetical protein
MVPSGKPEIPKNCRGSKVEAVQYRYPVIYGTGTAACRKEETLQGMPDRSMPVGFTLVSGSTVSRVISEVSTMMLISPFMRLMILFILE